METIKKTVEKTGMAHPTLAMFTLGGSSALMTASGVSGFISYGKLGSDSELAGTKNLLLVASLLSLLAAALQGLGVFLIHRTKTATMFRFLLLILSALLMLTCGIMYILAFVKLSGTNPTGVKYKDTYGTSYAAALASMLLTLGGLGAVGIAFLITLGAMRQAKKAAITAPPVKTPVTLKPAYTQQAGAEQQLKQLQVGTGVAAAPPQAVGTQ